MKELNEFVSRLQSTGSRIEKEKILSTATEFQKKVLEFLFNPFKVTGISKKKLQGKAPTRTGSGATLLPLLSYLTIHNTGRKEDIDYVLEVAGESEFPELVLSIVRKDLTLGVNATTLNKVFGKGFIPTFGVQLAKKYFDDPEGLVPEGTYFTLTEKLDGVRCVLMFEKGQAVFYTRSGKRIEGLVELEKDSKSLNPCFVYDGELLIDKQGKSNNLYRDTMSIVGSDGVKKGIRFNVFDCVQKEAFMQGREDTPYLHRRDRLTSSGILGCEHIVVVPVLYEGLNQNEIMYWLNWAKEMGKEGVMINLDNAPYICDRAAGLLKVKTFNECEGFVRSIETGTGKNEGRLGAVIVDIKDKDGRFHKVRVGSGFKDEERDFYFAHQHEILNKVVEISYFEVTHNKADDSLSLRFPIWLGRIRADKTLEDMNCI